MSLLEFDNYDGLLSSMNKKKNASSGQDDGNYHYPEFDTADVDFADINDVMSTYNSATMSPYSNGSSPDNMFPAAFNPGSYDDFAMNKSDSENTTRSGDMPSLTTTHTASSLSTNGIVKLEDEDLFQIKRRRQPSTKSIEHGITKGKKFKSPHNLIEKKYRTNINTKIVELRNCVPALRILVAKENNHHTNSSDRVDDYDDDYEGDGYTDDEEKLDGLQPARKLNKATILSKAAEYIKHLEWKNEILMRKNERLLGMLKGHGNPADMDFSLSSPENDLTHSQTGSSLSSSPNQFSSAPANAYPESSMPFSNKVLLGGMTCMLGASAFDDMAAGSADRKGLFSVPIFAFSTTTSSGSFNSSMLRPFLGLSKFLLCLGMIYFYVIVPLLGMKKQEFHPLKTYHRLMSLTATDLERFLKTTDPSKVYLGLVGLFNLEQNPSNLFVKSVYLKKCGELTGSKFLQAQIFDRLGKKYWDEAKDQSKDQKLSLLLENSSYDALSLQFSKKYEQFDLITQYLHGVNDALLNESLQKLVLYQSVSMKYSKDKSDLLELELTAMKVEINQLLERVTKLSKILNRNEDRCQILKFLVKPTEANLKAAFDVEETNDNEMIGLVCCALKYQLLNFNDEYDLLHDWFSKLSLPNFSNGGHMKLFEFVAILNVLQLTSLDLLGKLDEVNLHNDEKESHQPGEPDLIPRPAISKLNFKLLNVVANMRIFAGNKDFPAPLEVKDQLVEFFVEIIEKLNGF
ncbi:hypothetical protein OGAPHI_005037 [Ogataea philodendri]|uniref:BHLH domain-containing protein n=1 Tax=Ogataea philodendri TaxID=1378263 RepID=A0A9P8T3B6_9ASCO|nr:uncharacterized protein OGAPHI_005037 [Ogataea philodendri]KAH3663636.1 hypothetical protein OGAPHI_005037 [Ogataea philodendri]